MTKNSNLNNALRWITDILNRLDISYQTVGGLAAKCYGSTRPLHDIDFYVPGKEIPKLKEELYEYIELGPKHHQDDNWDIIFMKLNYNGQQIEVGDADNTKYFDSQSQRWIKEEINFSESNFIAFEGVTLPVMPKQQLIRYKQRLDRTVDRIDIKEMQNEI